MKILLLNNRYPSSNQPQVATFIKTIKECLEEAGASVDLLVNDTNAAVGNGFRKDLFSYMKKIRNFKNYGDYDLIYCNHLTLYALALVGKFKEMKNIAAHWHGTDVLADNSRAQLRNRISFQVIPNKTHHITPSKYYARILSNKLGIDAKKVFVSPSGGVNLKQFNFSNKKKSNDTITLGFSSGIMESKGILLIIDLLKRKVELESILHKQIKFKLIEYGKEKLKYKERLIELGVTILPPFPKDQMNLFYQQIDILLFPTLRQNESLGLVSVEAMSCGVPVVGTNDFALPEYVIPGVSGELFEKNNTDELYNKLVICIKNIENYTPRKIILEKYSQEAVIEGYKTFLNNL